MMEIMPYRRQTVENEDIAAVTGAFKCDCLTTGPLVNEFELVITSFCCSVTAYSGVSGLRCVTRGQQVASVDNVLVSANTFARSANRALSPL